MKSSQSTKDMRSTRFTSKKKKSTTKKMAQKSTKSASKKKIKEMKTKIKKQSKKVNKSTSKKKIQRTNTRNKNHIDHQFTKSAIELLSSLMYDPFRKIDDLTLRSKTSLDEKKIVTRQVEPIRKKETTLIQKAPEELEDIVEPYELNVPLQRSLRNTKIVTQEAEDSDDSDDSDIFYDLSDPSRDQAKNKTTFGENEQQFQLKENYNEYVNGKDVDPREIKNDTILKLQYYENKEILKLSTLIKIQDNFLKGSGDYISFQIERDFQKQDAWIMKDDDNVKMDFFDPQTKPVVWINKDGTPSMRNFPMITLKPNKKQPRLANLLEDYDFKFKLSKNDIIKGYNTDRKKYTVNIKNETFFLAIDPSKINQLPLDYKLDTGIIPDNGLDFGGAHLSLDAIFTDDMMFYKNSNRNQWVRQSARGFFTDLGSYEQMISSYGNTIKHHFKSFYSNVRY
jgi:hypothetical protein